MQVSSQVVLVGLGDCLTASRAPLGPSLALRLAEPYPPSATHRLCSAPLAPRHLCVVLVQLSSGSLGPPIYLPQAVPPHHACPHQACPSHGRREAAWLLWLVCGHSASIHTCPGTAARPAPPWTQFSATIAEDGTAAGCWARSGGRQTGLAGGNSEHLQHRITEAQDFKAI